LSDPPSDTTYEARAMVLRDLGRYREAIEDFDRAQALDPKGWLKAHGPLFRAHTHALLGNLEAALADCATIERPSQALGFRGAPSGSKEQVTEKIRQLAMRVRAQNPDSRSRRE